MIKAFGLGGVLNTCLMICMDGDFAAILYLSHKCLPAFPAKKSVSFSKRAHCDPPLPWSQFYLVLLLEENVSDASLLFINFKALLPV